MTNMDIFLSFLAKPLDKTWYHTSAYHLSTLVEWTQQLTFDALERTRNLILMNLEERKRS